MRVKSLPDTLSRQESGLFTERRVALYAVAIAVACAFIAIQLWPILHADQAGQHCLDFTWIWLTGKLAASHAGAAIYDPSALAAAKAQFLGSQTCILDPGRLDYPPTLLFFIYPLGLLPYSTALGVWNAATLLLYLAAIYAILPRPIAVVAALTTYSVALNLLFGHNGFLTAGLFGLALASMERRPVLSGVFLGLLTYKPQFGILFPLALAVSRNWRVVVSATAASVMFGAAAALAFGYQLWPSFIEGVVEEGTRLNQGSDWNVWFVSVLGVLRQAGISPSVAWAVQLSVSAIVAAMVCVVWARPLPHSLKAAAIGIGALAASPYALSYDYCILSVPFAFLIKDGVARGFLRGELSAFLVCWLGLSFFAFVAIMLLGAVTGGVGGIGHRILYVFLAVLPIIICAGLFAIVVRRARLL